MMYGVARDSFRSLPGDAVRMIRPCMADRCTLRSEMPNLSFMCDLFPVLGPGEWSADTGETFR